jgi:TPR repeat protein
MRSLALELLRAQDYDRSIAVYREIVRHTPDDARSHYDLAAALSFVQRYGEAIPPIRAAIRLEPNDLKAQEMASLIFLKLRWYKQAFEATLSTAELGEPTAMFSLVNMYEIGLGVTADVEKARYWAIKAAEHGHLGAMALMEEACRNGRLGQRIDENMAKAWAERLREAESARN